MNIFSFFSGAGFLDLGFEMTNGYNVVYVSEFYKTFNDIYQYSRAHMQLPEPRYGHHIEDITKLLEPTELERLRALVEECRAEDLTGFIGGPPCPDFSIAGSNKGKDGENGKLSGTYTELIAALRPDFFLFENVKGLYRTKRHREFFEQLKQYGIVIIAAKTIPANNAGIKRRIYKTFVAPSFSRILFNIK